MNKKIKIILCICLAIIVIIFGMLFFPKKLNQPTVSFENKSFQVELAQTDQERQQGLMYREFLEENEGMLFIFDDEGIHSFWMKNTLIPLDIIWINEVNWENRVVDIKTAQPCTTLDCETYVPDGISRYVLEINAGLAKKYDIKVGDLLYIE